MGGGAEMTLRLFWGCFERFGNLLSLSNVFSFMTIMCSIIVTCQLMASRLNGCCVTTFLWPVATFDVVVWAFPFDQLTTSDFFSLSELIWVVRRFCT
jgi:hypothetical protein